MNAIKQVRKYLEQHPTRKSSFFLANLVEALGEEREIPLRDLYELDHEAFELAIELIKDWRLDRYYAARIKLFDLVLAGLPGRNKRARRRAFLELTRSSPDRCLPPVRPCKSSSPPYTRQSPARFMLLSCIPHTVSDSVTTRPMHGKETLPPSELPPLIRGYLRACPRVR